ncbi:MAG: HipA domain-containing protein, partial [Desulfosarcinaceae bacterium]
LAWNKETNEFRSGQVDAGEGFEYWLMKFDGITGSSDTEVATPKGYGKIEYAYHLMAVEAGIEMTTCRLHHEGGRSHFMTKRVDRSKNGKKLHLQSLGAMAHYDYRQPASYSYEQAIQVIRRIGLPRKDMDQQVLRAIFNVVGRNCDDHVKNIAFLMNRRGDWRLSPAFDISDGFEREDLLMLAKTAGIKKSHAEKMIQRVIEVVSRWLDFAGKAGVNDEQANKIHASHRTKL